MKHLKYLGAVAVVAAMVACDAMVPQSAPSEPLADSPRVLWAASVETIDVAATSWDKRSNHWHPVGWSVPANVTTFNIWERGNGTGKLRVFSSADYNGATVNLSGGVSLTVKRKRSGFYASNLTSAQLQTVVTYEPPVTVPRHDPPPPEPDAPVPGESEDGHCFGPGWGSGEFDHGYRWEYRDDTYPDGVVLTVLTLVGCDPSTSQYHDPTVPNITLVSASSIRVTEGSWVTLTLRVDLDDAYISNRTRYAHVYVNDDMEPSHSNTSPSGGVINRRNGSKEFSFVPDPNGAHHVDRTVRYLVTDLPDSRWGNNVSRTVEFRAEDRLWPASGIITVTITERAGP